MHCPMTVQDQETMAKGTRRPLIMLRFTARMKPEPSLYLRAEMLLLASDEYTAKWPGTS